MQNYPSPLIVQDESSLDGLNHTVALVYEPTNP